MNSFTKMGLCVLIAAKNKNSDQPSAVFLQSRFEGSGLFVLT